MLYELGPRARRVYQLLLERIRSGELAPGMRLPAHTQLAASFGIAPLTMRQVLARLEGDGLVVRERGRGTFVRGGDAPNVLIVTADAAQRAEVEQQVLTAGKRPLLATTPADALAALEREAVPSLVVVDLHLPHPTQGLRLLRKLRERLPGLALAVLNPSRGQQTRLDHTVAPPLLMVGDPPLDELAQVLRMDMPPPGSNSPMRDGTRAHQLELLLARYLELQLAGERAAARTLMVQDGLASGLSVPELYRDVLQPAQYRIGDLWQGNHINVAREHLATAVTETVMVELAASAPRLPNTKLRVLVACVEGERHDIGARMVADILDLDGCTVRFLGADVPTDSLVAILREESPHALILSAAMAERFIELRAAVARVRVLYGQRLRIFVGGQIMRWAAELVRGLDVDLAALDATETLAGVRRLSSPA
jgi:MerR family transcriptional regulator, light-induced transcriptional regulator